MSLIADALKTAQREKELRESRDSGPSIAASVLIPLRDPAGGARSRKLLMYGLAGILFAVTAVIVVQRTRRASIPPSVRPLGGTIVTEALADSARMPGSKRGAASPTVSRRSTQPALVTSRGGRASPVAVAQTTTAAGRAVSAVSPPRQVQPDTAARAAPTPAAQVTPTPANPGDVQPAGQLRIAVAQPRPTDARRLFAEAVAAHRAGNVRVARGLYERVLTLVPNDPDALNNLGVLLSGDGEFDRALGLLRRAATIAPRNAGTWSNIGTALREQGRSNDAIAAFRHALTIDPTHQAARVGLAQQYLAISALAPAKELLDQALATNPDLAEAQYTLGQVLELQGDRAGAIRAYSTFIRVAPARLSGHAERVRQHLETLR